MFRIEKFWRAFLPVPKHKMTMWLVFEFIISMESWREFQPVLFRMHESVVSAWHIQDWRRVARNVGSCRLERGCSSGLCPRYV